MFTAAEIAKELDGQVVGDPATPLTGFSPASTAKAGDLTFAENETFFHKAEQSAAAAILIDGPYTSGCKTLIRVPNARVGFARVLPLFFPERMFAPGIHPSSVCSATAEIDSAAHIGPFCVIGEKVKIGPKAVLRGGNHVGDNSIIGAGAQLFPNAVLYSQTQIGQRVRIHAGAVIGADGFGYVLDAGIHRKIPQVGQVIIHDDVEIGANVTIDRGALGPTIIGKGTKIDNLVQIAHNVIIGEHCLVVAQVGIAGSTTVEDDVMMGGQVGVGGHITIAKGTVAGGQSGITRSTDAGSYLSGYPAIDNRTWRKAQVIFRRLPELKNRIEELEQRIAELEEKLTACLQRDR